MIFEQLLQADVIRYVQVDACRMGGVDEALAVILMARGSRKAVCPHAGDVHAFPGGRVWSAHAR